MQRVYEPADLLEAELLLVMLRVYEFLCNRLMSDTVAPDRRHHEPIKTPHHRRAA